MRLVNKRCRIKIMHKQRAGGKYRWKPNADPPEIGLHSEKKHEVFKDYLEKYLRVLCRPPVERLVLTIVDGFAGGGCYQDASGNQKPGSPLVLHDTVSKMQKKLNDERADKGIRSSVNIDVEYFFIEKDTETCAHLKNVLAECGIGGDRIRVMNDEFDRALPKIIKYIKDRGTAHHSIFFLDPYGYTDVSFPACRKIFSSLRKPEIILTLATDWISHFFSHRNAPALVKMGFPSHIVDNYLRRKIENSYRPSEMQKFLHENVGRMSGGRYHTPFFIMPARSRKAYWLSHMSTHHRARFEMVDVHWNKTNIFQHYGDAGLEMFGYDALRDDSNQGKLSEYRFDDWAKKETHDKLVQQIPAFIKEEREISRNDFLARYSPESPASSAEFDRAIKICEHDKEIVVAQKYVSGKNTEILLPSGQTHFDFHRKAKK